MENRLFKGFSKIETETAKADSLTEHVKAYELGDEDKIWENLLRDPDMEQYLRLGFSD